MPPRQRTPEGPPPAPAVQKLRVQYARRGRLRFSSTRDFARAIERALRRAQVPMAFSAGFHPHPKISYAGGAPTGMSSEAEYFEIGTTQALDPERLRADLDAALPDGLDIVEVVPAGPGSLADRLEVSEWVIAFPEIAPADLAAALGDLLSQPAITVTRVLRGVSLRIVRIARRHLRRRLIDLSSGVRRASGIDHLNGVDNGYRLRHAASGGRERRPVYTEGRDRANGRPDLLTNAVTPCRLRPGRIEGIVERSMMQDSR